MLLILDFFVMIRLGIITYLQNVKIIHFINFLNVFTRNSVKCCLQQVFVSEFM